MDFKRVDDTVVDDKGWFKKDAHWDITWGCETGPGPTMQIAPARKLSQKETIIPFQVLYQFFQEVFFGPESPRTKKTIMKSMGGADGNLGMAPTPFETVNGRNPVVVNVCTFACAAQVTSALAQSLNPLLVSKDI